MSDLKTIIQHDESDDKLHIAHTEDIQPTLDSNARARAEGDKHSKWGDWNRVASIPPTVAMQWMQEGINVMAPNSEDQARIKKKLNSPEYAYLRTRGGRL